MSNSELFSNVYQVYTDFRWYNLTFLLKYSEILQSKEKTTFSLKKSEDSLNLQIISALKNLTENFCVWSNEVDRVLESCNKRRQKKTIMYLGMSQLSFCELSLD